jgi:hypothetical protein
MRPFHLAGGWIASRRPNRTRSFAAVINLTAAVMALEMNVSGHQ